MLNYKIDNISYSIASNSYDKNSKLIDKISQRASHLEDKVSIGETKNLDFGGVKTQLSAPKVDLLMAGDQVITQKQTNFFDILKEKFNKIRKTESVSSNDAAAETNLIELTASVNEAEIALQQIVQVRDKLVAGFKEILNSSF
jgi:flagellar hook-basal body complex protein FliE